ncbi:TrbM/KikA/MpfK family conjugal transfer protein [uncultured Azohydromonas sp.]|jgi:TrbM.|uniref:TrbM/KikA/MpfK family conjugal transfer protein n=1 Tax=uncultured Azohydromonas sp. TaxID=487342 RepID=UPI0026271982|nr:TrbM/KikA/MpfK family conjugal transfer protein [uncultured Azohydromonas sp.]
MKRALTAALAGICLVGPAQAQTLFTGDTRLACEAIMCLSSSQGSNESACQPSLERYFSIRKRKLRDTIRARHDFLNQCPDAQKSDGMRTLVSALAAGAGQCDAANLNTLGYLGISPITGVEVLMISNVMPAHCTAIYTHPNTAYPRDQLLPRYVGVPDRGGLWADPADYDRVLAEYNARIAAEDAELARNGWWWR